MATVPRKQAPRLARPAVRYWKGKAPKGVADAESDSDVDDEQAEDELGEQHEDGDILIKEAGDIDVAGSGEEEDESMQFATLRGNAKSMNIALKDVSISKDGNVIVAGRLESGKTEVELEGMLNLLCGEPSCQSFLS